MSISVKTGKTTSDYFAVTKTVTDETARTISLVYPCDLLAPTVTLKGGRIDANYLTGLFDRKYWITNQTVDKGITYLHCTIDAWASWSDSIYNSSQFVTRSEKHYNPYIPDSDLPIPSKQEVDVYPGKQIIAGTETHIIGVI